MNLPEFLLIDISDGEADNELGIAAMTMVMAAAIHVDLLSESGMIKPVEKFYCQNGAIGR